MRTLRKTVVVLVAAALCGFTEARAQDDSDPGGAHSCCEEVESELAPLPDDATQNERRIRAMHERRDANPQQTFLNRRYVDDLRARLAAEGEHDSFADRFAKHWTLSLFCVQVGDIEDAIARCEECVAMIEANPDEGGAWLPHVLFRLAAAHFRLAERQNCISRHNEESCIFPLSERARHVETRGPKAAIAVLERLLADPAHDLHLEGRWLLNIAHMALGSWPDGVPAEHRIAPERLRGEATLERFVDRAAATGLARHDRAGSIVVDDFTGDGRLDVLQCTFDTGKSMRLSRNSGDGAFEDVTRDAGLEHQLGGIALAQGDVDGDGRLDVAVARGGGLFSTEGFPNSLLRQDRDGHFVDVTDAAGVAFEAPSRAVAFADVDVDGDLDLFFGCESMGAPGAPETFPSRLFLNDGTGRFADGTAASAIANRARCISATFGDVDDDGDPDLFLSNFLAANRLYVNHAERREAAFTDEAAARGVAQPESSGPAGFVDADQDGDLDLLVAYQHHHQVVRTVAAWMIDGKVEDDTTRLFANDGRGAFTDVSAARGLRRSLVATGLNFGDVDNDGAPDVYVATGSHDLAALFPNVLLVQRDGVFRDATFPAGVGHLQKGNGVAFGDIDDDGDLDLCVQIGGWYLDDGFVDACFENPGQGGHWLAVDLVGTTANRCAIGARIRARVETPDGARDVFHTVGPGASAGANPLRAHLGLGDATRIECVEVRWPGGGEAQRIDGLALDRAVRITQGKDGFEESTRPPFRLAR